MKKMLVVLSCFTFMISLAACSTFSEAFDLDEYWADPTSITVENDCETASLEEQ